MVSLVTTKNTGQPLYEDWFDAAKRQDGQIIMGNAMLDAFAVSGTDEEAIVRSAIQQAWDQDCSIWMRYDGDLPDSFAILEDFDKSALTEEEEESLRAAANIKGMVRLSYIEVNGTPGQPITRVGRSERLTLRIYDDTRPGQTNNKRMNVVIPSDFANFDSQYLSDMAADVEAIKPPDDDPKYLLSSLTFRRCL